MNIGWNEGIFFSSILLILWVIAKLNKAIKLLNNRVNMHSSLLKRLKKQAAAQGEVVEREDLDLALKAVLDRDFR